MDTQVLKRAFSVGEFHRMAEAGVFGENDRLELLAGEIVRMTPIGSHHAGCVNRLTRLLTAALASDAVVAVQNPVVCSDRTELQPDLAILKPRPDFYSQAHPQPHDVVVVFEVADTSAGYDRNVKMPAYACAGVPALVTVDLAARAVDVYSAPADGVYREHVALAPNDVLIVPGVGTLSIQVGQLVD